HLWSEISRVAPRIRQEWESPYLWQRIQASLAAEAKARPSRFWFWAAPAMAVIALTVILVQPWRAVRPSGRDLLTESALREVQQAESAYVRSIGKLSELAVADLERSPSPAAAAYREKLAVLDSAIA